MSITSGLPWKGILLALDVTEICQPLTLAQIPLIDTLFPSKEGIHKNKQTHKMRVERERLGCAPQDFDGETRSTSVVKHQVERKSQRNPFTILNVQQERFNVSSLGMSLEVEIF